MKIFGKWIWIMGLTFMLACNKNPPVSNDFIGTPIIFSIPPGFPQEHIFQNAPLTQEGFVLGKKIFYDGILSKDGSISCSSCHQQVAAFGTYDHDLSHGIYNQHSNRNAPPLFHLAWQPYYGWDGRYSRIEDISEAHILRSTDMAGNFSEIISRMKSHPYYPALFEDAYGTREINKERILKAISQFVGSIMSVHTKYDSVKLGLKTFSVTEEAGYQLFMKYCNTCHTEPLFTDGSFRNNGLLPTLLNDNGRQSVTGLMTDRYKFKVPTLRNLYLSFPFMHDGRFIGFSQIYGHYAGLTEQSNGAMLDRSLENGITLNVQEQNQLTDFLKTLTDTSLPVRQEYK
jgi:cytochrome c peroxidase